MLSMWANNGLHAFTPLSGTRVSDACCAPMEHVSELSSLLEFLKPHKAPRDHEDT